MTLDELSKLEAAMDKPADFESLCAIRNAAPALIECARLLREARDIGPIHTPLKPLIDAALARLEK
jgi:hypothetical protein